MEDEQMIDDIPQDAILGSNNRDFSKIVTDYSKTIEKLRLWLLGWRINKEGKYEIDEGRKPILNEEGADEFCSWLESHTASPIPLSRHKENEAAFKLRCNDAALCKALILNEEDWDLNFDHAEVLLEIADDLNTAALNGSIDQKTLGLIVKQFLVTQKLGQEDEKKGFKVPSIFGGKKNEPDY